VPSELPTSAVNVRYCSICSTSFDIEFEGCEGSIGIVPFAFCPTCRVGVWDWAQVSFDLVPNPECPVVNCPRDLHDN